MSSWKERARAVPMIWRRCASRSARRWRALSASRASADAARRAPQRAREQELVPAVGAVELQLCGLVLRSSCAHVVLDLGQQLASLVAALRLRHQPLLELQADVARAGRSLAPGLAGAAADLGAAGPAATRRSWVGGRWARADAARAATTATSPSPAPSASATVRPSAAAAPSASNVARAVRRLEVPSCIGKFRVSQDPRRPGVDSAELFRCRLWDRQTGRSMQRKCGAEAAPVRPQRLDVAWESADKAAMQARAHQP